MNIFRKRLPHPLESTAATIRLDTFNLITDAGFGHIGGAFSSADIFTSLYFGNLFDFSRDHFVLSAGHICPSLYATLSHKGLFSKKKLSTYSEYGSFLQGHISSDTPGVEYSSGSLGQGLSFACGLALGDKSHFTVCLTSDGEHNEGQVWEAAMFAPKYHLGNLINIIDHNRRQIAGTTDEIMPLRELAAKYIRHGWTVTTVDGHNLYDIEKALTKAKNASIYPTCIIANTTLGKGISFMEGDHQYHDIKLLPSHLYDRAKNELTAKIDNLSLDIK